MKNVIISLFLSLLIFSCAIPKSHFFSDGLYYPPYIGEVQILDKLPEKYIDIGWINIADNKTWIEMYIAAKDKARQHGANAIVYSPANCKNEGKERRSIVCKAIYIEHNDPDQ